MLINFLRRIDSGTLKQMRLLKAVTFVGLLLGVTFPVFLDHAYSHDKDDHAVFGPRKFARDKGKPEVEKVRFSVAKGGEDYAFRLVNGDGDKGRDKNRNWDKDRDRDRDGDSQVSSASITLNGVEVIGPSDFQRHEKVIERKVTLQKSNFLSVLLEGKPGSFITVKITGTANLVNVPNVVGMAQANAQSAINASNLFVGMVTTASSSTVPAGSIISQNPSAGIAAVQGSSVNLVVSSGPPTVSVPNVVGMTQAYAETTITSVNLSIGMVTTSSSSTVPAGCIINQNPLAGATAVQGSSVSLVVSSGEPIITVPNIMGMTQSDAIAAITAGNLTVGDISTANSSKVPTGNVISQNPAAGSLVNQNSAISLVVSLGPAPPVIPPDPVTVAPPVDGTVATTVLSSTAFLYTGSNPIQTGVAPGTIEIKRAAVHRGQVNDRDGNPLSGVIITILNHPEFGQTVTRTDGMFDMAVNGGGYLTVTYEKAGYLPAQRQVNAPWQDYAWLPVVALIQVDAQVTTINLATASQIQVHQGNAVTDAGGTRQATLLFSPGTTAQMVMPDGSTQSLGSINVRATEYTVGPNGPKAMPGQLPPASGYTYAVELSADEAIAAGAKHVTFSQPVYVYVDNFIGFPVGGPVPTGYYDRSTGQWIASQNGRVINILSITGGLADIDTNGDGLADDATTLAALGITQAEQQQMAPITRKHLNNSGGFPSPTFLHGIATGPLALQKMPPRQTSLNLRANRLQIPVNRVAQ